MVMGDDSCSKIRGIESLHRILDGHLDIVVKLYCLFEQKRVRGLPIFIKRMRAMHVFYVTVQFSKLGSNANSDGVVLICRVPS